MAAGKLRTESCCPSLTDEPCSGHGTCNTATCTCVCSPRGFWAGLDCAIPLGQECFRCQGGLCGGHALCSALNVCVSSQALSMTLKPSLRGGPSCDPGWEGECCNMKSTETGCLAAEVETAEERCSGHGVCGNDGACYKRGYNPKADASLNVPGCDPGWSGGDCSCAEHDLPCSGQGCPSRNKLPCSGHGKCGIDTTGEFLDHQSVNGTKTTKNVCDWP